MTLERTTFSVSCAAEYLDARELAAQTGQPVNNFATVARELGYLKLTKKVRRAFRDTGGGRGDTSRGFARRAEGLKTRITPKGEACR